MLSAILSGFGLAILAPVLNRCAGAKVGWLLGLLPAGLFVYFARYASAIATGGVLRQSTPWLPQIGVDLSFRLDGLSLIFALLITGIGALIVVYSGRYLAGHRHQGRFFSFLLMFMASMLGLVLADDVISLFAFWEMTSLTSFLLIGFNHLRAASRRAAMQALLVTGLGGLALLAGVTVMGLETGVWSLSQLLESGGIVRDSPLYGIIVTLVVVAAFTKSAQTPFHFWLPNAMEAPTPVSAYLHSATMVKAGVYLLMRLTPVLGGTAGWIAILTVFGAATLTTGTLLAIRQSDLKLILAYTTVASLGLLVMLIGIGSPVALEGAVLYLLAHALFKGALFMIVGGLDQVTGTRDIAMLGGLRRAMPITFAMAMLAALSMGGVPVFVGFLAKESIYRATIGADFSVALTAIAMIGNALMFAAALAVAWRPFAGVKRVEILKNLRDPPLSLLLGPSLLACLGLVFGILTGPIGSFVIAPMLAAMGVTPTHPHAALWHGVNTVLVASAATMVLGLGTFMIIARLRKGFAAALKAIGWGPDRGYDQFMAGLQGLASGIFKIVQPGLLRHYLIAAYAAFALALLAPFLFLSVSLGTPDFAAALGDSTLQDISALGLAIVGAVILLAAKTRLIAIVMLGVHGSAIALLFLLFGAPDLSFTQFMVEILSVVILTLVMTRLKLDAVDSRTPSERLLDGGLSLAVAIGIALVLTAITQHPLDMRLSEFFAQASATLAHGRNIVNVILVDFRALDTLGEITVVMTAGLAAIALISLRPQRAAKQRDVEEIQPHIDLAPGEER
ncbi:MAG: putative monovalent cation/H+ antiporter subunit A [Hyphomicrobiales bacterium]